MGVSLRDWTDNSEEKFKQTLLDARTEVEMETQELLDDAQVVSVSMQLPDAGRSDYRFRTTGLSKQGARIIKNMKSTLEIAGRPLSIDEKRRIAIEFLRYVMGDEIDGE